MKTVNEAAALLQVSNSYVRRLCRQGRIRSLMHGRDWIILDDTKEDMDKHYEATRPKVRIRKVIKVKRQTKIKNKIVYRVKRKPGQPFKEHKPGKKRGSIYEDWVKKEDE